MLALKAAGFETDKSDVLSALISRFVNQVDVAEKAATLEKGMDLKSILDAAGESSISETAEVSALKTELKAMISAVVEKEQTTNQNLEHRVSIIEDFLKIKQEDNR